MSYTVFRFLNPYRQIFKSVFTFTPLRWFSVQRKTPSFGLLIDIDGVIIQGESVIPKVVETFTNLKSSKGKFVLPTLFVTNEGNQLTIDKAEQLSKWLGIQVPEDHVVCAYDPFKAFHDFHDKQVLVTGQGRAKEIATAAGFKNVVTIADLLKVFPMLDALDITKRVSLPIPEDVEFSPVEAIVLIGEPVLWGTFLQLLMDILLTNGDPRRVPPDYPYPHIPVLACNMDLQWRFAPQIPRFGHGAFLLCLESIYKKITGKDLQYRVKVGKPSVVTYKYAQSLIMKQARELGIPDEITTVYMIGDNINTDIFGANLYNDYLTSGEKDIHCDPISEPNSAISKCVSVLVRTGVSSEETIERQMYHVHRDFLRYDKKHRQPTHVVQDFSEAIKLIFQLEKFD